MRRMILTAVVLIAWPVLSMAESRSIAVRVGKGTDGVIRIAIHSEEKKENKKDLTVAEAASILQNATGWGSRVFVVLVLDSVDLKQCLPVLNAIAENVWLDLIHMKDTRYGGFAETIWKHYGVEPTNAECLLRCNKKVMGCEAGGPVRSQP